MKKFDEHMFAMKIYARFNIECFQSMKLFEVHLFNLLIIFCSTYDMEKAMMFNIFYNKIVRSFMILLTCLNT